MKKKKAQIHSEVILYLSFVIAASLLLFFGYRIVVNFKTAGQESDLKILEKNLREDLLSLSKEYGSVVTRTYSLPAVYDQICFADATQDEEILTSKFLNNNYAILKSSIENTNNTLFVLDKNKKIINEFKLNEIRVTHYPFFACIKNNNGEIKIKMEGQGNSVNIKEDFIARVNPVSGKEVILTSLDGVYSLRIPADSTSATEISIKVIGTSEGETDLYEFSWLPESTSLQFSNDAELSVKLKNCKNNAAPPINIGGVSISGTVSNCKAIYKITKI
jgi:hypothetical protein